MVVHDGKQWSISLRKQWIQYYAMVHSIWVHFQQQTETIQIR